MIPPNATPVEAAALTRLGLSGKHVMVRFVTDLDGVAEVEYFEHTEHVVGGWSRHALECGPDVVTESEERAVSVATLAELPHYIAAIQANEAYDGPQLTVNLVRAALTQVVAA